MVALVRRRRRLLAGCGFDHAASTNLKETCFPSRFERGRFEHYPPKLVLSTNEIAGAHGDLGELGQDAVVEGRERHRLSGSQLDEQGIVGRMVALCGSPDGRFPHLGRINGDDAQPLGQPQSFQTHFEIQATVLNVEPNSVGQLRLPRRGRKRLANAGPEGPRLVHKPFCLENVVGDDVGIDDDFQGLL